MQNLLSGLALALAGSMTLSADAIPYPYPGTIAPTAVFQAKGSGDVIAYFDGSTAMFSEELGLYVNGLQQGGWGLEDHASMPGEAFDFGPVQAGDTLVFALKVAGYGLHALFEPGAESGWDQSRLLDALRGNRQRRYCNPSGHIHRIRRCAALVFGPEL